MLRSATLVLALAGALLAETPQVEIDKEVASFSVSGLDGKDVALPDLYGKDDKAVVVVFWSTTCPVCAAQLARLMEISSQYAEKGVKFVLVNPNPSEDVDAVRSYLEAKKLDLSFLRDAKKTAMKQFAAQVTPACYLLDAKHVLRYMGMMEQGRPGKKGYTGYLPDAIDALLAGKDVKTKSSQSSG